MIRSVSGRSAKVLNRLDVEYGESPDGDPVPLKWTSIEGDPPISVEQCTVDAYELNVKVEPVQFAITFPSTTMVQEQGEDDLYVVLDDGSHRTVHESELLRGATVHDLMMSKPGEAKLVAWKWPRVWGTLVAVAVVSGVLLIARKVIRNTQTDI